MSLVRRWWNPRKNAARVAATVKVQRCDYAVLQIGRAVLLIRRPYRSFGAAESFGADEGGDIFSRFFERRSSTGAAPDQTEEGR